LREKLGLISQKTKLAEAICYTLSRWEGLTHFLLDGRIEIDSNTVERSIRPIALNRLDLAGVVLSTAPGHRNRSDHRASGRAKPHLRPTSLQNPGSSRCPTRWIPGNFAVRTMAFCLGPLTGKSKDKLSPLTALLVFEGWVGWFLNEV
jgi:hypothetical protein